MKIQQYEAYLAGCRFCPMCKPFGEVSSVTKDEAHSTRVRGMLLWQVASGKAPWSENTAKIVYESSLNSVNQAWCITHYPVSDYILAARADLVEAGLAPFSVLEYTPQSQDGFAAALENSLASRGDTIFYPGDALAAGDPASAKAALELLAGAGQSVCLPDGMHDTGALAYCLGRLDQASAQAEKVVAAISGASVVLADGPLTLWALTYVYPLLGVNLPPDMRLELLATHILDLQDELETQVALAQPAKPLKAYLVGSEFSRLVKQGYTAFRDLMAALPNLQVVEPYDRLELAHSSGASGGLHLVAPRLGAAVSRQRVDEAGQAGADMIVCDSALDAAHLRNVAGSELAITTFAELIAN